MKNYDQLQCIKNTIATINNYSDYCIELKPIFDKKDEDLLKEANLITRKNGQITWTKRIVNTWKTNEKIMEFLNILYSSCVCLWLINFSK